MIYIIFLTLKKKCIFLPGHCHCIKIIYFHFKIIGGQLNIINYFTRLIDLAIFVLHSKFILSYLKV